MDNVTLDSKLDNIRNSTYAATVRESIASAIEQIKDQVNALTPVSGNSTVIETYVNGIVDNRLNGYALSDSVYSKTEANSTFAKTNSVYSSDVADSTFFKNADVKTELDSSEENDGHVYSAKYVDDTFLKKTDIQNENDASDENNGHVYSSNYIDSTFVKSSILESSINDAISNIQVNNSGLSSTINDINEDIDELGSSISSLDDRVSSVENALNGTAASNISDRISTLENSINEQISTVKDAVFGEEADSGLVYDVQQLETNVSSMDGKIDSVENAIEANMVLDASEFSTEGYLNANGQLIQADSSEYMKGSPNSVKYETRTSDYIPVFSNDEITVSFVNFAKNYKIVAFDAFKNFIEYRPTSSFTSEIVRTTVTFTLPDGTRYIRVSGVSEEISNIEDSTLIYISREVKLTEKINSIELVTDYQNSAIDLYEPIPFSLIPNSRVYSDGTIFNVTLFSNVNNSYTLINGQEHVKYYRSSMVDVRKYKKLRIRTALAGTISAVFIVGFRRILSVIQENEPEGRYLPVTRILDVPEGAEYFMFSVVIDGTVTPIDYVNDLEAHIEDQQYRMTTLEGIKADKKYDDFGLTLLETGRMNYIPYEKLLSGPILCIGDSLTVSSLPSGSAGYTGVASTTYPQWLAQLTGFTVNSLATSGATATSWYNQYSASDISDYKTFIVWLGTNAESMSVNNTTKFDEETFIESYKSIILKIINSAPSNSAKPKIIIGSVFHSSKNMNSVNQAIREIPQTIIPAEGTEGAEGYVPEIKFSDYIIGVAELDDGSLFGPTKGSLHGNNNWDLQSSGTLNPHFTNAGYFYLANKWLAEIRRCIGDNLALFN